MATGSSLTQNYSRSQSSKKTPHSRTISSKTNISDAEIIAAVTVNEKLPENDEDIIQAPKILFSKGLKAVETTLQYFELQESALRERTTFKVPFSTYAFGAVIADNSSEARILEVP
ncbi:hypothetical protein TNCV_2820301 [Trichonephila clavipes]|nr:hypothetical protein TNCV_2820301 [Trichonephila clavipes]